MKYYFFSAREGKISNIDPSPIGKPSEYLHKSGKEDIYFRMQDGTVTNVMCEAESLGAATLAVQAFLKNGF